MNREFCLLLRNRSGCRPNAMEYCESVWATDCQTLAHSAIRLSALEIC